MESPTSHGDHEQSDFEDEEKSMSLQCWDDGGSLDEKDNWNEEAVEEGKITGLVDSNKNHLVFTDNWPSFAFSLLSLGCTNVNVACSCERVFSFLKPLGLFNITFVKPDGNNDEWKSTTKDSLIDFVWVQGTSDFISYMQDTMNEVDSTDSIPKVWVRNVSRKSRKVGPVISHATVGGVTSGKWEISGSKTLSLNNDAFKSRLHKPSVGRRLGHILKDTVKQGISVGSSSVKSRFLGTERTYAAPDRIPSGKWKVPVLSGSVFKASKLVKRWLTLEELEDAYDLQVDMGELLMMTEKGKAIIREDLVNAVPGKVTHRIAESLLTQVDDSDMPSYSSSRLSTSGGPRVKWLEFENEETMLNDEKAARNDDLEADVDQWDNYVVNHFNPAEEWKLMALLPQYSKASACMKNLSAKSTHSPTKPLICVGGIVTEKHRHLFGLLRKQLLQNQKRDIYSSFRRYLIREHGDDWARTLSNFRVERRLAAPSLLKLNKKRKRGLGRRKRKLKELEKDALVGAEAISRYNNSDWWDWSDGSTLHFWRWHPDHRTEARDGTKVCTTGRFEPYLKAQQWSKDEEHTKKMKKKVLKVVNRRYMNSGPVVSLTGFFAVPKGESDIRLVYDATKCGFNDKIWAPSFLLPTIDDTLEQVDIGGWMGDIDLGEMFLNFPLDEQVRKYVGLDLSAMKEEIAQSFGELVEEKDKTKRLFLRWTRCLMGLRCSPYNAVRHFAWAEEFIRGNPDEPGNPFGYSKVVLNLPGSKEYDPRLPTVRRVVEPSGELCANFEVYIDDIRICGPTLRHCVRAARRIASRCNYLGIQDAARKRRFPSQTPGVWSGAKSISTNDSLYTSTTLAKWTKGGELIRKWLKESEENNGWMDRKSMEKGRGFLVHLSRTYPILVPYLKGIHHTLEAWRTGRGVDGWKFSTSEWKELLTDLGEYERGDVWTAAKRSYLDKVEGEAPALVDSKLVGRFKDDLTILNKYFESKLPPRRLVRGNKVMVVRYGFGDASGAGFGSSWETKDGVKYRFGVWGGDKEESSSNFRELKNIVDTFEAMTKGEDLSGSEVFFFTDNSTAEKAFYKGSSTSKTLHELISRLHQLELTCGVKLKLCHVSGTRMIEQGSDGLSRGNLEEGVMAGKLMGSFIPLHLTALDRNEELLDWIRSWVEDEINKLELLEPKDWYTRGHDHGTGVRKNIDGFEMGTYRTGTFVWAPPPGAALACLQQLRKARLKRTNSSHIFVCPRLMEPHWRKQVHKSADVVFEIPACAEFWPFHMHEPLILALYFPFLSHRPWQLRGTPTMLELEKRMRRLWKRSPQSSRIVLQQLWSKARGLQNLSPCVVFKMLRSFQHFDLPCGGCDN